MGFFKELYQEHTILFNSIIFSLVFFFVVVIPPLWALFGGKALEKTFNLDKVTFYWIFGAICFIMILLGQLVQWRSHKNPKVQKKLGWFGSIIHNPDMSIFYMEEKKDLVKGFRWIGSAKKLFLVSLILFAIVGLWSTVTNTFWTDLPHIGQQVTELGTAVLEVEPAGTEIFGLLFLVGLIMYTFKYLRLKYNWDKIIYWVLTIPSTLLVGTSYGVLYHLFRYSESEKSLFGVAIFWFIAVWVILFFGSIIPLWLYKDENNLFQYLATKFTDEKILIVTIAIIFLIALILIFYYIIKKQKKKKEANSNG